MTTIATLIDRCYDDDDQDARRELQRLAWPSFTDDQGNWLGVDEARWAPEMEEL